MKPNEAQVELGRQCAMKLTPDQWREEANRLAAEGDDVRARQYRRWAEISETLRRTER